MRSHLPLLEEGVDEELGEYRFFGGGRFWLLEVFDGSTSRKVFDCGTSVT